MALPVTQQVKGLKELNDALLKLSQNVAKNVLRGSVRVAAMEMRNEVKLKAPMRSGQLKRSVYVKHIPEQSSPMRQTFKIGVRAGKRFQNLKSKKGKDVSTDAYYAPWVEYGHMTRRGKQRKMMRKRDENLARDWAEGTVRWIRARPFMRPAWEARKFEMVGISAKYIAERIPQEVAKSRGLKGWK